jgi:hypothetical protein
VLLVRRLWIVFDVCALFDMCALFKLWTLFDLCTLFDVCAVFDWCALFELWPVRRLRNVQRRDLRGGELLQLRRRAGGAGACDSVDPGAPQRAVGRAQLSGSGEPDSGPEQHEPAFDVQVVGGAQRAGRRRGAARQVPV